MPAAPTGAGIEAMKVDQLKAALKAAGLPTVGRKAELQARLLRAADADASKTQSAVSSAPNHLGAAAAEPQQSSMTTSSTSTMPMPTIRGMEDEPPVLVADDAAPKPAKSTPVRSRLSGLLAGALSPRSEGSTPDRSPDRVSSSSPGASASKPFAFAKMVIELQKAASKPKTFEQTAKEEQDRYFRAQQELEKERRRSRERSYRRPKRGPQHGSADDIDDLDLSGESNRQPSVHLWQGLAWVVLVGALYSLPPAITAIAAPVLPLSTSLAVGSAAAGATLAWAGAMPVLASLTSGPLKFGAELSAEVGRALWYWRISLAMLKDTIVQLAADIKDGKIGELWMVEYMTVTAVVLSAFYLYSTLVAQWDALPVGTGWLSSLCLATFTGPDPPLCSLPWHTVGYALAPTSPAFAVTMDAVRTVNLMSEKATAYNSTTTQQFDDCIRLRWEQHMRTWAAEEGTELGAEQVYRCGRAWRVKHLAIKSELVMMAKSSVLSFVEQALVWVGMVPFAIVAATAVLRVVARGRKRKNAKRGWQKLRGLGYVGLLKDGASPSMAKAKRQDDEAKASKVAFSEASSRLTDMKNAMVPGFIAVGAALIGPLAWLTKLSKICESLHTAHELQVNKYDQALSVAFGLPPMMVGLLENSLDGAEFECPLLVWGFSVTAFGQWVRTEWKSMLQGGIVLGVATAAYQGHELHQKWREKKNNEKIIQALRAKNVQRDFKEVVQFSLCMLEGADPSLPGLENLGASPESVPEKGSGGSSLQRVRSIQSPLHGRPEVPKGSKFLFSYVTLFETQLAELVKTREALLASVNAAAEKTTPDFPFLHMLNDADWKNIRGFLLNIVSERYSNGYIAQSMGMRTKFTRFYFGMVNERGTDVQTKKLRVVLAKETTLKVIASLSKEEMASQIELKKSYYKPRLRTLRAMASLYQENSSVLRDIDLCIPINAKMDSMEEDTAGQPSVSLV